MDNKKTIIKEYLFTGESYNTIDECLKELFIDIEPIIRIYCNKRKRVWFKNINNCVEIIQNPRYVYNLYLKMGNKNITRCRLSRS